MEKRTDMITIDERIVGLVSSLTISAEELKGAIERLSMEVMIPMSDIVTMIEEGQLGIISALEFKLKHLAEEVEFEKLKIECYCESVTDESKEWCKTGWGYKPRLHLSKKGFQPKPYWNRTRSNPKQR